MRLKRYLMVLVAVLAPLVVQAQTGRDLSTDQRVLTGSDWRLVSFGTAGAETNVIAGTTVNVKFGEDGRASGSTGCNSYSGTYQVRGDSITIGRLASTRRACLDQNANQLQQRMLVHAPHDFGPDRPGIALRHAIFGHLSLPLMLCGSLVRWRPPRYCRRAARCRA